VVVVQGAAQATYKVVQVILLVYLAQDLQHYQLLAEEEVVQAHLQLLVMRVHPVHLVADQAGELLAPAERALAVRAIMVVEVPVVLIAEAEAEVVPALLEVMVH
jgi:hypothetical protein